MSSWSLQPHTVRTVHRRAISDSDKLQEGKHHSCLAHRGILVSSVVTDDDVWSMLEDCLTVWFRSSPHSAGCLARSGQRSLQKLEVAELVVRIF